MRVYLISLTLVLVLMDHITANPLLEGGLAARTFFQQNMKCGARSTYKRITMSGTIRYPSSTQNCVYTIRAYNTKICQVRIDFKSFELTAATPARPYAHCNGDRLKISGSGNSGMEFDLCGNLRGQHVYVPFDVQKLADELVIEFRIPSNAYAYWDMELKQIECTHKASIVTPDESEAPEGCLQYFYNSTGRVESFNYGSQYLGDTNYAICFNRNNYRYAKLKLSDIEFDMDIIDNGDGFDSDCLDETPTNSKDFIAIPFATVDGIGRHSLFCGESLHEQDLSFTGSGPIIIHVNTDTKTGTSEKGFRFRYDVTDEEP